MRGYIAQYFIQLGAVCFGAAIIFFLLLFRKTVHLFRAVPSAESGYIIRCPRLSLPRSVPRPALIPFRFGAVDKAAQVNVLFRPAETGFRPGISTCIRNAATAACASEKLGYRDAENECDQWVNHTVVRRQAAPQLTEIFQCPVHCSDCPADATGRDRTPPVALQLIPAANCVCNFSTLP